MSNTVTIEINSLRCHSFHGVMAQERKVGNMFEVTVHLRYPADDAVDFDRLDGTINYAEVCGVIQEVMSQPSDLLEHVCGRLRRHIIDRWPRIEGGRIRITKPAPPIPGVCIESVAVNLEW